MIPDGDVVTGPSRRVTLSAGVGRTSEHKWPLVRAKLLQSFAGSADIFHTKYIVNRKMRQRSSVVKAMLDIQRHGLTSGQKHGRFVHVIPETGDAHVREILVQPAPPIARAGQREVAKDAVAGPHRADKSRTVGAFHEYIVFHAQVVWRVAVARIFFDVQVGNQHGVESLGAEVGNHFFKIWKLTAVDGEWLVFVLIVNVQINGVDGNFFVAKSLGNFVYPRFRLVGVARLLETQSPQWRQFGSAGQSRKILHDFAGSWPSEKVVVD